MVLWRLLRNLSRVGDGPSDCHPAQPLSTVRETQSEREGSETYRGATNYGNRGKYTSQFTDWVDGRTDGCVERWREPVAGPILGIALAALGNARNRAKVAATEGGQDEGRVQLVLGGE